MAKKFFRSRKEKVGFFTFVALLLVVPALIISVKQSQDIRNRAYESPAESSVLAFNTSYNLDTTNQQTLHLTLNTQGKQIDGVQLVAYLNYGADSPVVYPASTSFLSKPDTPLNIVTNNISLDETNKRFIITFVAVTKNPNQPFTSNTPVELGYVYLSNKISNSKTVLSFNSSATKVINHATGENIVTILPNLTIDTTPPPANNPVGWETPNAYLTTTDFRIKANGQIFLDNTPEISITSDPGYANYTTLEATWRENGVEMRMFIYFKSDDKNWWVSEIRTYNGQTPGDWIYYPGPLFTTPLGQVYTSPQEVLIAEPDQQYSKGASITLENLRLKPTFNQKPTPTVTEVPTVTPTTSPIPSPDSTSIRLRLNLEGISPFYLPQDIVTVITTSNGNFFPLPKSASTNWDDTGTVLEYQASYNIPDVYISSTGTVLPVQIYFKNSQHLAYSFNAKVVVHESNTVDLTNTLQLTGDINNDNLVDIEDYHLLAVAFDPTLKQPGNPADLNHDDYVDIDDYNLLVKNFAPGKPGAPFPSATPTPTTGPITPSVKPVTPTFRPVTPTPSPIEPTSGPIEL